MGSKAAHCPLKKADVQRITVQQTWPTLQIALVTPGGEHVIQVLADVGVEGRGRHFDQLLADGSCHHGQAVPQLLHLQVCICRPRTITYGSSSFAGMIKSLLPWHGELLPLEVRKQQIPVDRLNFKTLH